MLSAHQPYASYPDVIKQAARELGGTAQVAGGVPAMCDGVTQGQPGMELSLFSRDVIALSAAVALSHNVFDGAIFLGICDKIVPGLVVAAASFGHLPCLFMPAGPMPSGIPNKQKARVRQKFAAGEVGRDELLKSEMQSYHAPGTCTFYGTANSNQMLMEIMGMQLPGSSFINPDTELRQAFNVAGVKRLFEIGSKQLQYTPAAEVLDIPNFVNGIVGLHATGGSTNLMLHLMVMARAAGIILDLQDFSDLSHITPLMARVYPNGMEDVNAFQDAGGMRYLIAELLDAGMLHEQVSTVFGKGLSGYTRQPELDDEGRLLWKEIKGQSQNTEVLRPFTDAFLPTGGLQVLNGNLGKSIIKVSALPEHRHVIEAPARVFDSQKAVKEAFDAGELEHDFICVVRFQGPKSNGMPELHGLTPVLGVLQDKGFSVALVTDGRMSGASGKIPAAIHVSPEACDGGPIACIQDGDMIRLDANAETLQVLADDFAEREPVMIDLSANQTGMGRELFSHFRKAAGLTSEGATVFFNQE
jgi:phosphogluconate dehydratase